MTFTYLGQPFWHLSPLVRERRYEIALEITTDYVASGKPVYAPIVHNYHVAARLPIELVHDHDHWMKMDLPILRRAEYLDVLMMPGWKESRGLARECEEARRAGIPINYRHLSLNQMTRLEQAAE